MLNPMVQSDLVTYMGVTIVILFLQATNANNEWKCKNISRILDSYFHKNGYKQIKISDQKALMDQRPSFDNGQNEQEITNDEKLGLVEISPLKESLV